MSTRTITGNLKSLTDSAVATGTVTFEKLVTSTTGNTIHQSGVTTATTDASGDFSIALAVPASGSYRYRMILPNGASFYFSIASGASVNVATLIEAETITDQDAVVEALAGYLPLSGGTLTGALTLSGAPTVDLHAATKKYVDDNAGGGGAVDSVFGRTGAVVAASGDYAASEIEDDSVMAKASVAAALTALDTSVTDLETTKQDADADLTAIAALSPANDDVIQRKAGAWTNRTVAQYVTDILAGWAAHITTFLQSADAGAARTAIGAGTGNGDLLASNNLSDVTASTARTNLAVPGLAVANTFTAAQMVDGSADAIQLRVQGHSSQTAKTLTVENSGGTVVTSISNAGLIDATDIQFAGDTGTRIYRAASSRVDFAGSINTTNFVLVNGMQALARATNTLNVGAGANDIAIICPTVAKINDATTNAITNIVTLGHNTSGTPAAGLGAGINFTLETSTTADTQTGRVAVLWNTVTHASRVPDMVAYLTDSSAEREIWRGRATGSAAAIGFLGATPVARQAHIADAAGDDAATVNAILDVLEAFGLVATS